MQVEALRVVRPQRAHRIEHGLAADELGDGMQFLVPRQMHDGLDDGAIVDFIVRRAAATSITIRFASSST